MREAESRVADTHRHQQEVEAAARRAEEAGYRDLQGEREHVKAERERANALVAEAGGMKRELEQSKRLAEAEALCRRREEEERLKALEARAREREQGLDALAARKDRSSSAPGSSVRKRNGRHAWSASAWSRRPVRSRRG
jgi:hypothetical protein